MGDDGLLVADQIRREAGSLLDELKTFGWSVSASTYSHEVMGNWFVDISREEVKLRLVKDRGQYMLDGPKQDLTAEDLWRAFDRFDEFSKAVIGFAIR